MANAIAHPAIASAPHDEPDAGDRNSPHCKNCNGIKNLAALRKDL